MRYPKDREAALYSGGRLTLKNCINDLQNALRACRLDGMDTKEHKRKSTHHATTFSYRFSGPKNKKLTKLNAKLGTRVFQLRTGQIFEGEKNTTSNTNTASSQDKRKFHSSGECDSLMPSHSKEESLIHSMPRHILTLQTRGHGFIKPQNDSLENALSYGVEYPYIVGAQENNEERMQKCRESRLVDNENLSYFQKHPMLQQELIAEIDGKNIRFQLVEVDPQTLLQEHPIFMSEPLPSLIWPYD